MTKPVGVSSGKPIPKPMIVKNLVKLTPVSNKPPDSISPELKLESLMFMLLVYSEAKNIELPKINTNEMIE